MSRFELSTIFALLLLSTISFCLQLGAISGCDYVRIHFKALNDNGIYFNDDPYVGLGFFHHQTFLNKNTRDWEFDSTCHKYNPIEALMFAGGNLSSAKLLSLISLGINGFVVFGLFYTAVRIARGMKVENKATSAVWSILVSIFTATSLALQAVAVDKIHDEGGICDRDSYFPYEWNEKFPFQIYPEYAYFKFFHDCTFGPDGQSARASIFVSASVCAVASFAAIAMLMQLSDAKVKVCHDTTFKKGGFPLKMAMADDLTSIESGFITESDEDEHDSDDEEVAGAPLTVV